MDALIFLAQQLWLSIAPWRAWLLDAAFTVGGTVMSRAELLGSLLGVVMVVCNLLVSAWGWPLAIASSALYALLFVDAKLYGEAGLQLFFIAMAGWGWWQWVAGRDPEGQPLSVRCLSSRQRLMALGATLLAWPLLGGLLQHTTNSDVPYLDALPTVGSLTGQFLLGRKYLENWHVWLLVNLFSIVLFATKGLWLTVALYAVFAALAMAGWQAWRRQALPPANRRGAPAHA